MFYSGIYVHILMVVSSTHRDVEEFIYSSCLIAVVILQHIPAHLSSSTTKISDEPFCVFPC